MYFCEMDNGGLNQFFENTGFDPMINQLVLNGLEHMNAPKQRDLFLKVLRVVEETKEESVHQKLDDLTQAFWDLEEAESILDLNYEYIASIPDLHVVDDNQYEAELASILSTVPDYEERKAQADANKPRHLILAEALCLEYSLDLLAINAMDYGSENVSDEDAEKNEEQGIVYVYITTEQGQYYFIDMADKATLVRAEDHELIGSITGF